MKVINLRNITSLNEVLLDGNLLALLLYYSPVLERWAMNIENLTRNEIVNGIVVNTGEDILYSSGRLGLQALVPISFQESEKPATLEEFLTDIKLVYMTLEEYNNFRYDSEATMRLLWL